VCSCESLRCAAPRLLQGTLMRRARCDARARAQEMIDEADRDGDGEVNEEEFIRIMRKTSLF